MPNHLTLAEMAEALRRRRVSAVELVDAHLAEIERRDPELRAFVMKFPSEARAAAIQADNSSIEAPLHGIPNAAEATTQRGRRAVWRLAGHADPVPLHLTLAAICVFAAVTADRRMVVGSSGT